VEGVEVQFTLTAKKFNVNDPQDTLMLNTTDLHVIVSITDNQSCDLYQIQVIANNDAGDSSSVVKSTRFPALPSVQGLPVYSLTKMAGIVQLNVSFHVSYNYSWCGDAIVITFSRELPSV
jgi:hypothetical protein